MSNAEDLNRLTACSLVLLGHIFYVLGNHRVSARGWAERQRAIVVLRGWGAPPVSDLLPLPLPQ